MALLMRLGSLGLVPGTPMVEGERAPVSLHTCAMVLKCAQTYAQQTKCGGEEWWCPRTLPRHIAGSHQQLCSISSAVGFVFFFLIYFLVFLNRLQI